MKITNAKQYLMDDPRFVHIARVREGLRDYVCFCESPEFFARRKLSKPLPDRPQFYVEAIVPTMSGHYKLQAIEDEEEGKAIVGLLIIEGLVKETDLTDGYTDCVAAFKVWTQKAADQFNKLKEEIYGKTKSAKDKDNATV